MNTGWTYSEQAVIFQLPPQKHSAFTMEENAFETDTVAEGKSEKKHDVTPVGIGDGVKIINYFRNPVEGMVIDGENDAYIIEYQKSNNSVKQIKVIDFQIEKI